MKKNQPLTRVYLELGNKRVFTGAPARPTECPSGRDEASTLANLATLAPRYAEAVASTSLGYNALANVLSFGVLERLASNTNTDFGVPVAVPEPDSAPLVGCGTETRNGHPGGMLADIRD
jgi:hypothetical protein